MIAALPQLVVDAGAAAGVVLAIAGVLAVLWRTSPVQWLLRQIREDREERMLAAVLAGTEDIRKQTAAIEHLVAYHLGTNDTTMPWHQRLSRLEVEHGLEPARQEDERDPR